MASIPPSPARPVKHAAESSNHRSKRIKTALACSECRERKRKCDGIRPICGACLRKNPWQPFCEFDPDRTGKAKDTEFLVSLQNRIRQLEHMLTTQGLFLLSNHVNDDNFITTPDLNAAPLDRPLGASVPADPGVHVENQTLQAQPGSSHTSIPSKPAGAPQNLSSHSFTISNVSGQINNDQFQGRDRIQIEAEIARLDTQLPLEGMLVPCHTDPQRLSNAPQDALPNHHVRASTEPEDSDDDQQWDNGVDPMGIVSTTSDLYDSPRGMLSDGKGYCVGPSSTLGFMKQVQDLVRPKVGSQSEIKRKDSSFRGPVYSQGLGKANSIIFPQSDYVIPPREMADGLLACFWNHVHVLYPYLYKSAFNERYRKLWSSNQADSNFANDLLDSTGAIEDEYSNDPVFFCILNLTFALGCQYSQVIAPQEQCTTGDVFFHRAQRFVNLDSLGSGDCALVQALLLMGLYLQSTDMSEKCWNIIGLAIRVAQSVGLYINVNPDSYSIQEVPVDQVKHETRKRLWGGCVLHDRVMSMMFGRPLMLTSAMTRDLALPLIIDDEELTRWPHPPGKQPKDKPSYMTFWCYAIKLIQIAGEILEAIYTRGSENLENDKFDSQSLKYHKFNPSSRLNQKIKAGDFHEILQLDAVLTQWHDGLPSILKLSSHTSAAASTEAGLNDVPDALRAIFARQAKVLEVRFLHAKILLFRPVIVDLLSNPGPTPKSHSTADSMHVILQRSAMQKISRHCVLAARGLSTLIYDNIMAGDQPLPAWWYNVFYLYTAATIFVAERLCPPSQPDSIGAWQDHWKKCLQGLHTYRLQSRSARKCFKVLDLIDRTVFQNKDEGEFRFKYTLDKVLMALVVTSRLSGPSLHNSALNIQQEEESKTAEKQREPEVPWLSAEQYAQVPRLNGTIENSAQDMAWLQNVLFDPDIDIDHSVGEWYDDCGIHQQFS